MRGGSVRGPLYMHGSKAPRKILKAAATLPSQPKQSSAASSGGLTREDALAHDLVVPQERKHGPAERQPERQLLLCLQVQVNATGRRAGWTGC